MNTSKETVDLAAPCTFYDHEPENTVTNGDILREGIALLVQQCHAASYNRGWWHDPITGLSLIPGMGDIHQAYDYVEIEPIIKAWFPYVIATKIALIHSEVSEGLEAYRVDAMDDKIPFMGITAEMGDAMIRIADLMGCLQQYAVMTTTGEVPLVISHYDLGAAILTKLPFNAGRPDHDLAKRAKPGGKKF